MALVNQPTAHPTRKVSAGAISGALATICAWGLGAFMGVDATPGVEAALTTLFASCMAYAVREDA